MNDPLNNRFKVQIEALTGFEFQDFAIEMFLLKYGATGFTVLRQRKDKGCDGIINSEKCVVACYGPEDSDQKAFNKKADDDFEDYKTNWKKQYPNWMFVTNHPLSPQQIDKIKKLKKDATPVGLVQVLSIIEGLKNHQRRKLGKYLKIEVEFFASDYLGEILEDLLKGADGNTSDVKYNGKERIDVEEKIKLNYDQTDIDDAINEYGLLAECGTLKEVGDLMYGYEDGEITALKGRIVYDYNHLTNGHFKERLRQLSEYYLAKYSTSEDDDYLYYIRAVLINIFEQCLIGIKMEKEK